MSNPGQTHFVGDECPGGHRWRHGSGEDKDGCMACYVEAVEALLNGHEPVPGCTEAYDDGEGFCAVCGHHVEAVAL